MPRKSVAGAKYPKDWPAIARAIKEAADWRCVRCNAPHRDDPGYGLTVHHLDLNPSHSDPALWWWNLAPLCCKCHLQIQHKVDLDRPWVMGDHTPWFRPYVAGFYAYKYLLLHLSREVVERRIDFLLDLERRTVINGLSQPLALAEWHRTGEIAVAFADPPGSLFALFDRKE